jgi:hypothetical protein
MLQGSINFTDPEGPDVAPIIELHRGNDGWIAFTRKNALGQMENVGSVPARELPTIFREFVAPMVDTEGYYTINAMWRPGYGQSKLNPNLRAAKWGTKEARWLTACYVDFDFYKVGATLGQAVGLYVDLQEQGIIPPASMLTRSGRGLWAWWFLRDTDGDGPARAWAENVACYKRIERHLQRVMAAIEPDRGARDVARFTRVPGSLSRVAQTRVGYWIQRGTDGRAFLYTLDELATRMGIAPVRFAEGLRRTLNPKLQERARRGLAALWQSRLDKLVRLISHRGKIANGCRNRTALLLATFMYRCRGPITDAEIAEYVERLGQRQCDPPLTDAEIEAAFDKRKDFVKFQDATIGDWLKITPEESELIGWTAQGSHPPELDGLRTRADRMRARRELLRQICTATKKLPPLRHLCDALESHGLTAAPATVRDDLKALGLLNPRRWKRDQDDAPLLLQTADDAGVSP